MRFHFFSVPLSGGDAEANALNLLLASHRVAEVERHLVAERGVWAVCVVTVDAAPVAKPRGKSSRIDYREVLSEDDFAQFAELRTLRKSLAEHAGVPLYNVFTNAQLAAIVQDSVRDVAGLRRIEGVGEARAKRFGQKILAKLAELRGPDAST